MSAASAQLERLYRGLDEISSGAFERKVIEASAVAVQGMIAREFNDSHAPGGKAWKPLKRPRPRGRPNRGGPLFDSGALKAEATQRPTFTADGFYIVVNHPGATTHQYGDASRNIPPRPYFPTGTLPPQWTRVLTIVSTAELRKIFP